MWLVVKTFLGGPFMRILPFILLIGGAYWWHDSRVDAAYANGIQAERTVWEGRVRAENESNRKIEETLRKIVQDGIGQKFVIQSNRRDSRESKIERDILEFMEQNSTYRDCVVDDLVIEERNKIRGEGPK